MRPLVRHLAALVLVLALGAAGAVWYRSAQEARQWQMVERQAEGLRFRLPADWAATPVGYADPGFRDRQAGGGVFLSVRSWAIPPEIRHLPEAVRSPEAAAVAVWAEARRARALGAQRILDERRIRIDGVRGVLQTFETPRDALRYSIVAAAARAGRLYSFTAQVETGVEPDDAARTVRRILRTVEWLPLASPAAARPPAAALQR